MAKSSFKWGDFEPDISGIREIFHSGPVQGELQGLADSIAADCNAGAEAGTKNGLNVPAYGTSMDQGKYTSIGVVHPSSKYGFFDQKKTDRLRGFADSPPGSSL